MKRIMSLLLVLALLLSAAGCGQSQTSQAAYIPGSYSASAMGYGGQVTVTLTVDESAILSVDIQAPDETPELGGQAIGPLTESILSAQSAQVDSVAGATLTSSAVQQAAAECLRQASGEEAETAAMTPGEYVVTAKGIDDNMTLKVTVDETSILDIEVLENNETSFVADTVFSRFIPEILEAQTVGIDAPAGATATSSGIRTGVLEAVKQAGGDPNAFSRPVEAQPTGETAEYTADVVVAGSGIAGMSAAVAAANEGAQVIVLEKLAYPGGSAILSGGNMHGVGGAFEGEAGGEGDVDGLYTYWMQRANNNADPEMVRFMAENIAGTIDWLMEQGMTFGEPHKTMGLYDMPICLQVSEAGGLITPLYEKAQALGVQFLFETPAESLLTDDSGRVVGIQASDENGTVLVHADSVVLATGGFNANEEMKAQYEPLVAQSGAMQAGCPGNTGDGIRMGMEAGADTVFKPQTTGVNLQAVPGISFNSPVKNLAYQTVLGVTDEGVRYSNEAEDYSLQQRHMIESGRTLFYRIFDASTAEPVQEMLDSAVELGKGYRADTLEELAAAMGVDADVLLETVSRYNTLCAGGEDTDFGKPASAMLPVEQAPYYAIMAVPACSGSVGGLKINLDAQVLTPEGEAIPGLFAAGEVCNGDFFGDDYPVSGSVDFGATFGRIAGTNAAA